MEDKSGALVFGDGPIGLLMLVLLRRAGVENVVVIGGRPERLAVALELGADQTLDYHPVEDDLAAAVRNSCGQSFPNVIEASGSPAATRACLRLVAPCGRVVVLGDYGDACADFAWNHLLHQEIELIGSNASAGAWPEAVQLATEGGLPLARLITHRLPAARFADGVELVRSRRGDVIKVVLEWYDATRRPSEPGKPQRPT